MKDISNYTTPSEIAISFNNSAIQKNSFSTSRLFVYSIMGGAFIALGGLLAIIVAGGMPGVAAANPGIVKFAFGAVFPIGLVLVIIGGAELFTSDCAIIPFGVYKRTLNLKNLVRIWSLVFVGNFIGALLVAYFFAYKTEILNAEPWSTFTQNIGVAKTSGSFLKIFIKGIGANWLVCMAVWVAYAAKDVTGKIIAMWFPVMCFVALGMEHSIANMFFIPAAILQGADINIYQFLVVNLIPATLGNIVGGAVFVALAYWYIFSSENTAPENTISKADDFTIINIERTKKNLN